MTHSRPAARQAVTGEVAQRPEQAGHETAEVPYTRRGVTLLTGDAADVLRTLSAKSVDCVVTSPPYWRLRDYGTGTWTGGNPRCPHPATPPVDNPGDSVSAPRACPRCGARWTDQQYGLEPTTDAYLDHLRQVFAELRRVLAPTGTVWLNLGDSYATNSDGYWCARPGQYRQPRYRPAVGLPHKNLIGMPWKVALALQDDGWILRNAIVWHKPNAAPFPVRDRLACHYEWIFLLVKQPHYYFDLDPIRRPYTGDRSLSRRAQHSATKPHTARGTWPHPKDVEDGSTVRGRNPGNLWSVPVTPRRGTEHPAAFPLDIPLRCIAAGCPPGGLVLDCFSGTGTTALAARQLGRSFIGIDLNPAFHAHAEQRLLRGAQSPTGGGYPTDGESTEAV